jgi:hypothetical protein
LSDRCQRFYNFIIGYGSYEELVKSVGLSNEDVADNARKLLNR